MLGSRQDRVGDLLRNELADLIVSRLKDPRVGFVTIVAVEMSKDLKFAKVHYSVMGTDAQRASTHAALDHARGFLQREIAARLKLRLTPQLQFLQDNVIEAAMRVDRILKDLDRERRQSASGKRDR